MAICRNLPIPISARATPVVEKKVAALDVTQVRFGNNVRLNLKPTKFDANTVLVAIRFGGGRLDLPRDKPGLKLLADQTFIGGGLQQHSVDDLNRHHRRTQRRAGLQRRGRCLRAQRAHHTRRICCCSCR